MAIKNRNYFNKLYSTKIYEILSSFRSTLDIQIDVSLEYFSFETEFFMSSFRNEIIILLSCALYCLLWCFITYYNYHHQNLDIDVLCSTCFNLLLNIVRNNHVVRMVLVLLNLGHIFLCYKNDTGMQMKQKVTVKALSLF